MAELDVGREVILCAIEAGMSVREAADRLGLSRSRVYQLLAKRAKQRKVVNDIGRKRVLLEVEVCLIAGPTACGFDHKLSGDVWTYDAFRKLSDRMGWSHFCPTSLGWKHLCVYGKLGRQIVELLGMPSEARHWYGVRAWLPRAYSAVERAQRLGQFQASAKGVA